MKGIFTIAVAGLMVVGIPATILAEQQLPVAVSASALLQGDTLTVVVKQQAGAVTGRLGAVPLRFFRNRGGQDWVAVVGMPLAKKPGRYALAVRSQAGASFSQAITVKKRTFPVTKLMLTPELRAQGYTPRKIIATIENQANKTLRRVLAKITPVSYVDQPFTNPLASIEVTGPFGDIRRSGSYKIQHLGADLKADPNTPVLAVNSGRVMFADELPDYGKTLVIDHGLGVYSLYLHLNSFVAIAGGMVAKGDAIGLSGQTGYAIGPHLHFGVKVRGASVDPLRFVAATQEIAW